MYVIYFARARERQVKVCSGESREFKGEAEELCVCVCVCVSRGNSISYARFSHVCVGMKWRPFSARRGASVTR